MLVVSICAREPRVSAIAEGDHDAVGGGGG
jgi:hypothetical protein